MIEAVSYAHVIGRFVTHPDMYHSLLTVGSLKLYSTDQLLFLQHVWFSESRVEHAKRRAGIFRLQSLADTLFHSRTSTPAQSSRRNFCLMPRVSPYLPQLLRSIQFDCTSHLILRPPSQSHHYVLVDHCRRYL